MKIASLRSLNERLSGSRAERAADTPSPVHPYDLDEVAATLSEAERIEAARRELITRSDEIRLGDDPHPQRTIRALSQTAEFLVDSAASDWAKANTLSETAANLIGSDVKSASTQHIARLALATLRQAYPERPDDEYVDKLNKDEVAAHIGAMKNTNSKLPYPQAIEREWVELDRPLDPLIDTTEELVDEMWTKLEEEAAKKAEAEAAAAKIEAAKPRSERYDPFADDEDTNSAT